MLATFLSLMPDAALAVDAKGTIVAVNTRTESFFGYDAAELQGKPVELLVPERYRHGHRKDRAGYSAAPHARPMGAGLDLYARRRDGSEFPVDISLAPIGADKGSLVVAAVRDITERKALHAAQSQLAAIVQSSADGIFSITQGGVITSWNPAAEAMFGYQRSMVVGHHIGQFFPDDPVFEDLLDAARTGRPTTSRDTRWQTGEGAPLDVAISVSMLGATEDGGFSVLVRDVTARKRAEAQLLRQAIWQEATAEIRLSLLSDVPLNASLDLVCSWALRLCDAHAALVSIATAEKTSVRGRAGNAEALRALQNKLSREAGPPGGTDGKVTNLGGGLEMMVVPVSFPGVQGSGTATLAIAHRDGVERHPDEETMLASLASQAVLGFELATVRSERDRLLISADRERIARDLHDLVIQRLFGAGLRLQGALSLIDNQVAVSRVASTIDDLDTTIKEIREAIFALESPPGMSFRARVLDVVADVIDGLGFKPSVSFEGAADQELPVHVQVEAAAVLREALSNSARHAHASAVDVRVSVDDEVAIVVTDNGVGVGEPARLSGLANAKARAELLGGRLEVSSPGGGGTCFDWRVPLAAAS
jgi:PAS domain S-box-containing protein